MEILERMPLSLLDFMTVSNSPVSVSYVETLKETKGVSLWLKPKSEISFRIEYGILEL